METFVSDVTRFAGYDSPRALLQDPGLSRDEKISGLRTWRGLVVRLGVSKTEDDKLIAEIERALAGLGKT